MQYTAFAGVKERSSGIALLTRARGCARPEVRPSSFDDVMASHDSSFALRDVTTPKERMKQRSREAQHLTFSRSVPDLLSSTTRRIARASRGLTMPVTKPMARSHITYIQCNKLRISHRVPGRMPMNQHDRIHKVLPKWFSRRRPSVIDAEFFIALQAPQNLILL
jgi:hypothetical protein